MLNDRLDYGTPPRRDAAPVALTVDGVSVTVPQGTSVMRAAIEAGVPLPRLCATDTLEPFGSCRVCLVQIEGRKGYPASCTTPVAEGMAVTTRSDSLQRLRRNVIELYVSEHPLDCADCPADGNCELQTTANELGVSASRYGGCVDRPQTAKDHSNPYFTFDPAQCIVCHRCVRACDDIQGSFALTIAGRGFDSVVSAGQQEPFMASDCVSCGACVDTCPTAALTENSIIDSGQPQRSVITTCAYCGVGCGFEAQLRDDQVVNMKPWKAGKANEGHACVKGRFAYGYATHEDRITTPMVRDRTDQPWRAVSWDEAFAFAARRLRATQQQHGRDSVGAISSSRCTNEEVWLVQKLVRAGFGNNNIDTCARVCHSPTGYGLKTTLGESAGTQDFASVEQSDVILVMGSNPTDAHPVFASRLIRRLRQGAKLIVADPRRIRLVEAAPNVRATHYLPLRPGSNVAFINAMAHVVVTEGLEDRDFIEARCEAAAYTAWRDFISDPQHAPEATEGITGVPAADLRGAARLYATGGNAAIYYGLGVTEHSQGSTTVMGIANLAMATGNLGRPGVGVNPMRGQNNVQGSCDMGSFPHELPGYRHVSITEARHQFEHAWGVRIDPEPGLRIPNMFDAALDGNFRGLYCQGEDLAQSDPNTQHVEQALAALDCLIVQDLFLNETAKFAHVFLPGSSFLEKDGTFTNAERRISRVRQVIPPLAGLADWQVTRGLARALGVAMDYSHPGEIMDEIARLTPTFAGVSYAKLDQLGSIQWPCNDAAPDGTPVMHREQFVRGKGKFALTPFVPTDERASRRYPLLLTTGRILSQYNVGAQTRRTANNRWHDEDILELHPQDAEQRGIRDGDWAGIQSRVGETVLRARLTTDLQPGVVYTTFHHPFSGANVVTTENSDWATNCPEYKVTAVQVSRVTAPSAWQARQRATDRAQRALLQPARRKDESLRQPG